MESTEGPLALGQPTATLAAALKLDHEPEPPEKGGIDCIFGIGGQDAETSALGTVKEG